MRRKRKTLRVEVLLAAVSLLLGSCAAAGIRTIEGGKRPPPIVLIVLDELPLASLLTPTGDIDAELFPNFARLQRKATWFRNATTGATFTHEVMPSILTGARPSERLQTSPMLPHNLFTLLSGTHELYTTQPFPRFCPGALCRPVPRSSGEETLRRAWPAFAAGDRGEKFLSLASFLGPSPQPRLYFAHFVLPHQPWAYLPSGARYPSAGLLPGQVDVPGRGKGWTEHWWLAAQAMQRHLLQTRFTDSLLGALLDRMEERDIFDDALVIVTADHGIAFEPGFPKRIASERTVGQLASVPLFVKRPGQDRARISDQPVELSDITPTVADVVGLPYDWSEVDGRSLFHRKNAPAPARKVNGIMISETGDELYEAIRLKYRMFARRGDSIDLFRPGSPRVREVIGSKMSEFSVQRSLTRIDLANRGVFASNSVETPMVPALLHGSIEGPPREGTLLAIAVDGRVAAFTPTYITEDRTSFYCMLPPRFLMRTPHTLEIYEVVPKRRLLELTLEA